MPETFEGRHSMKYHKWRESILKRYGSWENYIEFLKEKGKAGGSVTGKTSGRFKKGELSPKLYGSKYGRGSK